MQEAKRRCSGHTVTSEYGLYPAILTTSLNARVFQLVPQVKSAALTRFVQPTDGGSDGGLPPAANGDAGKADGRGAAIIAACALYPRWAALVCLNIIMRPKCP